MRRKEKKLLSLGRVEPLLSSHITDCVMGYNSVLQKFKALYKIRFTFIGVSRTIIDNYCCISFSRASLLSSLIISNPYTRINNRIIVFNEAH